MIREGAKLVETAQDILDELTLPLIAPATNRLPASDDPARPLSEAEAAVLAALGDDPLDVDEVVARGGLPPAIVTATLTALELAGRVASIPGGRWQRIA